MLKIRLQRIGRKNDPSFRVVVIEHTRGPKSGDFVERVGSHNPKTKKTDLNADRITHWLSVGAQASGRVHNMLVSAGIIKADKVNVLPKKSPIIKEEPSSDEDTKSEGNSDKEKVEESTEESTEVAKEEEKPEESVEEETAKDEQTKEEAGEIKESV